MLIRLLSATLFVLAFPALGKSQTWTSPDGFLMVTPPDAGEFQMVPSPPSPFIGLWVSNDESMRLGVLKLQVPPNTELNQTAAEEGLAEQVGGEVIRLPTKQLSGHEAWIMRAKGPSAEITQAMIRNGIALYKLMAVSVGDKADAYAVGHFIDSLSIVQPSSENGELVKHVAPQPTQDRSEDDSLHNLSKAIGGGSALLGIGVLVFLLTRGKKKRRK